MALVPPTTDYTARDQASLLARLSLLAKSAFPAWDEQTRASFDNVLIALFAFIGGVLGYYNNTNARESRFATARLRKNLVAIAKLIGFVPNGASAATTDLVISLPSPPVGDAPFPAGTKIYTNSITSPIAYQLLTDAVIVAGANPPQVIVSAEHSETVTESALSSDLPNQEIKLGRRPFLDGSLVLVASNGSYSVVNNFLSSTSTDRHCTVTVDDNDRATVRFGNGTNGQLPVGQIQLHYKIGGGPEGNLEPGALVRMPGVWLDSLGNKLTPSVTNPSRTSGGLPRQSAEQIRILAPESLRTQDRSVAHEDFEIHAREVPGVVRALMLTSDDDPAVEENKGYLYVVPAGGGVPSTALKDAVLSKVTVQKPCTLTFKPLVKDPVYKVVNVEATLFRRAGVLPATAGAAARKALTAFFKPTRPADPSMGETAGGEVPNEKIDFGARVVDADGNADPRVAWSDVFNCVRDLTELRRVGGFSTDFRLNGAHQDVVLAPKEFPILGTVTLRDGDTGALL